MMRRRSFLTDASMAAAGIAVGGRLGVPAQVRPATATRAPLVVDPVPLFELSPYLYMQFMEPLGATDGSVEAAWDHLGDRWRDDLVAITRELAPTMMRWGGIFADFYRWREGVGPRDTRRPMLNLLWGGIESNQVGTGEFVSLCKAVGAEPLICVNFESDGRRQYMKAKESVRTADAKEAAAWVAYCNAPRNAERQGHGNGTPLNVRFWQIGNETRTTRTASTSNPPRARPSSSPGRCVQPIRRFGWWPGATAAGQGAWRRWPGNTSSTWRSTTCSTLTHPNVRYCAVNCTGVIRMRPGNS
jgi:alpha-N-arabinofuranosidase